MKKTGCLFAEVKRKKCFVGHYFIKFRRKLWENVFGRRYGKNCQGNVLIWNWEMRFSFDRCDMTENVWKVETKKLENGAQVFCLSRFTTMKKCENNILRTGNEVFCLLIYIILYGYIIGLFFCISIISIFVMFLSLEAFLWWN